MSIVCVFVRVRVLEKIASVAKVDTSIPMLNIDTHQYHKSGI